MEVLTRGASAVLPQHLPERWLNALLKEAEIVQQGDMRNVEDTCAGLLSAVLVLLSQQSGNPPQMEIAATTLMRYISYYFITLSAESVSRHTDIWAEPPTLENIFQEDRAIRCIRKSSEAP
jgi:hypothetical protein